MADKGDTKKISYYMELALKYRWALIIPLLLSAAAGIILSVKLPRVYEARTLILVEAQRVPSTFVQSIVSIGIEDRIRTISQQIMSRTNLEKIIKEFKLYSGPDHEAMFVEDQIADLHKRISVDVARAGDGADAFSISFKGHHPQTVMNVANKLATYFIDENLKVREAQAIGTSSFLEDELEAMRQRLANMEEKLKNYKTKYMGELPEQLNSNLRILDGLQRDFIEQQENLRHAQNRLMALGRQSYADVNGHRESVQADLPQAGSPSLEQLQAELSDLRSRYTEKHPDVVKLKKRIEIAIKSPVPNTPPSADLEQTNQVINESDSEPQIRTVEMEIKTIQVEISRIADQIKQYQKRVENTPKREQELLSLRRDYDNINASYNSLLRRKLEAEISVNMEKKQKGEQFRILDPARLPEKPIEPNLKKLFVMTIGLGAAVGIGIIVLVDFLSTSFRTPEEIKSYLKMPILAAVPTLKNKNDRLKRNANIVMSIVFTLIVFSLIGIFSIFCLKGADWASEFVYKLKTQF